MMGPDSGAFTPMTRSRKRLLQEVDPVSGHDSKRLHQPAAANKQAFTPSSADCTPTSKQSRVSIHKWLDTVKAETSDCKEQLQDRPAILPVKVPRSSHTSIAPGDAGDTLMMQQAGNSLIPNSSMSPQTEKKDPTSPLYGITLERNGVVLDQAGLHIPEGVKKLVDSHIRKQRSSPRLDAKDQAKIKQLVINAWHNVENEVLNIINSPLFDLSHPDLIPGGNTPWTQEPLPSNANAPCSIITPKPDKHFGFRVFGSKWSDEEINVANHLFARPYTHPSHQNMFPCLIFEFKSEATRANLYAAEAQAAGAGAHRVASFLWLLDKLDPDRKRASSDALAFSSVISQRQAVAYVHFYNPADHTFYMSFVDAFYFVKDTDAQNCRDYHDNVAEWMVTVLQPDVRALLTKAHPIFKAWKEMGQSASASAPSTKESSTPPQS